MNVVIYTTPTCGDCRRAKQFLTEQGIAFREVNLSEDPKAVELVLQANDGRRTVPTFEVDGRYFSCSPFNPYILSDELKIPFSLSPPKEDEGLNP